MAEITTYEPNPAQPDEWVLIYGSGLDVISQATWNGAEVQVTPVDEQSIYVAAGSESGELTLLDSEGNPATIWIEIGDSQDGGGGGTGGYGEGEWEGNTKAPELTGLSAEGVYVGEAIYAYGTGLSEVTWAKVGESMAQVELQSDDTVIVHIPKDIEPGSTMLMVGGTEADSNELPVEIWEQAGDGQDGEGEKEGEGSEAF